MSPSYVAFLCTILYPFIGAIIAVIVPHIIHATQLLADPWMQESWQVEAMCAAIVAESGAPFVAERWFIDTPAHPSAKSYIKTGVKAQVKAAPSRPARAARPLPAFLVRRHVVTREELVLSMDLVMSAAHAEVVAAHSLELQAETQVAQLRAAVEHASACAKSGYSSQQTKHLEKMAAAFKHIPERWRAEIRETRKCWRNPQEVHARLEDVLAYM